MKHTPGPWKYYRDNYPAGPAIVPKHGPVIAELWNDDSIRNREEHEANAHLIAAAPAMYEALEAAIDAVMWMSGASDFSDDGIAHDGWLKVRPQIAEWQKVLAAARGES